MLADEPTGNLDSLTARHIVDLLEEINRGGMTVEMVTHDQGLAARAGRRLHMLDGRLIDPSADPSVGVARSSMRTLRDRAARGEGPPS